MTSIVGSGPTQGRVNASAVAESQAAMPANVPVSEDGQPLFTCMSCAVAFTGAGEQRDHYRSELHRYNMKRRVANLAPVKADVFNAKIQEHAQAAQAQYDTSDQVIGKCLPCGKSFASDNAYRDHMSSKKHQQTAVKKAAATAKKSQPQQTTSHQTTSGDPPLVFRIPGQENQASSAEAATAEGADSDEEKVVRSSALQLPRPSTPVHENIQKAFMFVPEDSSEADVQSALKQRLDQATRIDATKVCMFCNKDFSAEGSSNPGHDEHERTLSALTEHMTKVHSYFIPEQTYLTDKAGLLQYLADKICISHMCIWCNARSKVFGSTEAVQGHMHTKGHCRIAYSTETDRLELGDFYDFSKSYPDAELYERKKAERAARQAAKVARKGLVSGEKGEWQVEGAEGAADQGEWEDDDVEMEDVSGSDTDDYMSDTDSESEDDNGVKLGDTEYELVLPSGNRIGHRSMKRYYNQRGVPEDGNSGSGLARRLLPAPRGKNQATAPDDGDNGKLTVSGRGGNHMIVRHRGEARAAKKLETTFADNRHAQRFNLAVGMTHNYQKHFRAQYLQ